MSPRSELLVLPRRRIWVEREEGVALSRTGRVRSEEGDDRLFDAFGGEDVVTELDGGAGGEVELEEDGGLERGGDVGRAEEVGFL